MDCAINQVLPQIPPEKRFNSWLYQFMKLKEPKFRMTSTEFFGLNFRRALPVDLVEGNLKALSLQGLGQVLFNNLMIFCFAKYKDKSKCK